MSWSRLSLVTCFLLRFLDGVSAKAEIYGDAAAQKIIKKEK